MNSRADEEMVEGFFDGYDRNAPEPSSNRSHCYRHGFMAGRNDIMSPGAGPFAGLSFERIRELAEEARQKDAQPEP